MPRIDLRRIAQEKRQANINKIHEERQNTDVFSNSDMFLCENCESKLLIPSDGSMVCTDCGLYQSRDIYTGNDNNFNNGMNDKPDTTRVGMATHDLMPELNKTTIINYSGKGKCRNSNKMNIIMNKSNWASMNYRDSTSLNKLKELETICSEINIPKNMIEEIKIIFYKLNEIISVRNKKLDALKACSVIIAYKEQGINKDFSKLSKAFNISIESLRKHIKENEIIWKQLKKKLLTTEINKNHTLEAEATLSNKNIKINTALSLNNNKKKNIIKNKALNNNNYVINNSNILNNKDIQSSEINSNNNINDVIKQLNNNIKIDKLITNTDCNKSNDIENKPKLLLNKNILNKKYLNDNNNFEEKLNKMKIYDYEQKICILVNTFININKLITNHTSKTKHAGVLYYLLKNNFINTTKENIKLYCSVSESIINTCYKNICKINNIDYLIKEFITNNINN